MSRVDEIVARHINAKYGDGTYAEESSIAWCRGEIRAHIEFLERLRVALDAPTKRANAELLSQAYAEGDGDLAGLLVTLEDIGDALLAVPVRRRA
jgi:hypothetical protein